MVADRKEEIGERGNWGNIPLIPPLLRGNKGDVSPDPFKKL